MKRTGQYLLFVIGCILLALAFTSPLSPYAARSLQQGWQTGHVLLFAIGTYLLFPLLGKRINDPGLRLLFVFIATLLGGLLIEYLQRFVGREFSLRDVILDVNGYLLALCVLVLSGGLCLRIRAKRILYALTGLLSLYTFTPLAIAVVDEINMYRDFPRLADFDSRLEAGRWRGDVEIVKLISEKGDDQVLKVQLTGKHFSGVTLAHFPKDWRAYRQLQLTLFNPGRTPLALTIRIHDNKHYSLGQGDYYDRFNRVLTINPGWNTQIVDVADIAGAPHNRTMDIANIEAIGLFSVDLPRPRAIYIDKLSLVP